MKTPNAKAHFVDNTLINPTNPIKVNLIGAGGTGSHLLTRLAVINQSLVTLGHAGLLVRVFDDDVVTEANKGRQPFAEAEVGLKKVVALINRVNRFFGTAWKAIPHKYNKGFIMQNPEMVRAAITISCVDNVAARFEIADILKAFKQIDNNTINQPLYWMDFGNGQYTGQVLLSTISAIKQPASKKFAPVAQLPFITDEFKDLLNHADTADDTPSCSLAEALQKQDLFINSSLAEIGSSLLWRMFREGMIMDRGIFVNLREFRTQPLKVA